MKNNSEIELKYYDDSYWNSILLKQSKIKLIEQTFLETKQWFFDNGLNVFFNGDVIPIIPENIKTNVGIILNKDMADNGQYDPENNIFFINEYVLSNGKLSAETTIHEATHSIVEDVVPLKNNIDASNNKYKLLSVLEMSSPKYNNKFDCFGMSFNGSLYCHQSDITSPHYNQISNALYVLQIQERCAFLASMALCENISEKSNANYSLDMVTFEMNNLLDFYEQKRENALDLLQAIDEAQLYIAFNITPKTELAANIAYDMMALLEYENNKRNIDDKKIEEFGLAEAEHMAIEKARADFITKTSYKTKALELSKINFASIGDKNIKFRDNIVLNDISRCSLDQKDDIKKMEPYEQRNNPIAILDYVLRDNINVLDAIHDLETFMDVYYSHAIDVFPKEALESIAEILGPEFSPERRDVEMELRDQKFKTEQQESLTENRNGLDEDFWIQLIR